MAKKSAMITGTSFIGPASASTTASSNSVSDRLARRCNAASQTFLVRPSTR